MEWNYVITEKPELEGAFKDHRSPTSGPAQETTPRITPCAWVISTEFNNFCYTQTTFGKKKSMFLRHPEHIYILSLPLISFPVKFINWPHFYLSQISIPV